MNETEVKLRKEIKILREELLYANRLIIKLKKQLKANGISAKI